MHDPTSATEIVVGTSCSRAHVADLAERVAEVGRVGAVDERSQLGEVDLDDLVEEPLRGRRRPRRRRAGRAATASAASAMSARNVARRYAAGVVVVGEDRRGRADLGAHVADRGLAGRADRGRAGSEVLDDRAGAAAHA